MGGNVIIGQSGGPTAVINSSLAGVFKTAKELGANKIYGMKNGVQGLSEGRYVDLGDYIKNDFDIDLLMRTPAAFIGSCRFKLPNPEKDEDVYKKIFSVLRELDINYFFYIGGNDSMDTCHKISKYMLEKGYECRVIGVPKTIDNDLWFTDHCPGFGSAARYIATTCMELATDARVYRINQVTIVEIMGRNAGWLTAASQLATETGIGPDLIYLPERPFVIDEFYEDVEKVLKEHGYCFVAVSEGIVDKAGELVAKIGPEVFVHTDSFGHVQLGGAGQVLANLVREKFSVKVRPIELNIMQRCASHTASQTDVDEAFRIGVEAVESAINGKSGYMAAFERIPGNPYRCEVRFVDLKEVANKEQKVPDIWINARGNGLTDGFVEYCRPLIRGNVSVGYDADGLPRFARLKRVLARP